ncbi:MAG: DUF1501 domain-containing protein, partial [Bacteroidetes bacterium]
MHIQRRSFLQISTLATGSLLIPKLLKAFDGQPLGTVPAGNKVLIIVQFSGGNDGLNTVIPVTHDVYQKLRPTIGFKADKALKITDDVALHPALTGLQKMYGNGDLAILNGVGYDKPDRSHFRSMDIWQTGSSSSEVWQTGWLGRYLDHACNNCPMPTQGLELDDTLSLTLKGKTQKGLAVKDPKKLYTQSQQKLFKQLAAQHHEEEHEKPVDYLYKTLAQSVSSAGYIYEKTNAKASSMSYPATELGKGFKNISSLVLSDVNTKVYYISLGSFDTHVGQQATQQRLFKEFNDAVEVFVNDMKANNRFQDVLLMTFSEFGRRVGQNASGGTDHGTANNMFFMSGGLKEKGLLNPMADLGKLTEGDLEHSVD